MHNFRDPFFQEMLERRWTSILVCAGRSVGLYASDQTGKWKGKEGPHIASGLQTIEFGNEDGVIFGLVCIECHKFGSKGANRKTGLDASQAATLIFVVWEECHAMAPFCQQPSDVLVILDI